MANDPEDTLPKKSATGIAVGQDLAAMSEYELLARIAALEGEIVRCRAEMAARQTTRAAADSFFRKA
jgi:uncharacterized small protein (DUF1192 family)